MGRGDLAEAIAERIEFEGPDTVAAVILEPVQNAGGCFTPPDGYFQRVREICDEYDVLLISDEVICAWGRLGEWFGSQRYDYQPDLITTAKGLTSAYAPMGARDRLRSHRRAVPRGDEQLHPRVHVRRPPGVARRSRWPTSKRSSARACSTTCAHNEPEFRGDARDAARSSRSSATSAAPATSRRSSWSRTRTRKESFSDAESETLLRGFLSGELYRRGLICRADDRGDPVIQLSPPLIAGPEQFEEIEAVLRPVLTEAASGCTGSYSPRSQRPDSRGLRMIA